MRVSRFGSVPTRSDRPVPRLSKQITRANDDTRSMNGPNEPSSVRSMAETKPGISTMSIGPSPNVA